MPKRTRKEKFLAERRRLTATPVAAHADSSGSPSTTPASTFQFQAVQVKKARLSEAEDTAELSVITRDLGKTLILAVIAIAVEVFIYWLLHGK